MDIPINFDLQSGLKSNELKIALKINGTARSYLSEKLRERGYLEIPPVIYSTATDPLNHPVFDTSFVYYDTKYSITRSMIFHKQVAVQTLKKIFSFSPNVRLETAERAITGRHLSEFTQIDLEELGATRDQMIHLEEELILGVIREVKEKHREDLLFLNRELKIPQAPFEKITYKDAFEKFGKNFEEILSVNHEDPFWIIDIPINEREFYDREDPENKGYLLDMDLIYPQGFGEASSGGEREFEIDKILQRIRIKNQNYEDFKWFIDVAREGLQPSAGFGIGIERLLRYICGYERIEMVTPFPKIPGKKSF
ncbi:MAG: asparagine synthetase A [Thermoplasmataceae archaeon]